MLTFDIAREMGLEEGLEVHDSIVVLQLCSERTFQDIPGKRKKKKLRKCLLRLAFLSKKKKHGGSGFLLHKKGMSSKSLG